MKVLLKEDIDNIGMAGEVHKVANGYGRNYLLPQGLAVMASPSMMKQATAWRKKADARRAELRAEFEELSTKIEAVKLAFTARAGETGKLFGSVTTSQIADDLNAELGTELDRRKVGVEPLRQLGEHKVVVRLSGEFQPELTVVIANEDGEIEPAVVIAEGEEVVEVETAVLSEVETAVSTEVTSQDEGDAPTETDEE
ncbi:LSU ribosomal protein L9p [hydrothermal vent metagenome]|uniref:LSU ribosomal protein L9p n=1 Tax=hydrothermal vent metagenome TaxID=652676 RepID=A0A3B0VV15_9ZZZZ